MQALPSPAGDNRTVPGFIGKLWQMVDDDDYRHLICWDLSGTSFHIVDEGVLSKQVLPLFYKHNNISSFIRQLNFYGFQKKPNLGALKQEAGDSEFSHPYFVRGRPELLAEIKRKTKLEVATRLVTSGSSSAAALVASEDVDKVLVDVQQVKHKVDTMDARLNSMKKENSILWRELSSLRQKHMQQQQVVHKLVQFLLSMAGRGSSRKRRALAIEPGPHDDDSSPKRGRPETARRQHYTVSSPENSTLQVTSLPPSGPLIQDVTSPPRASQPTQPSTAAVHEHEYTCSASLAPHYTSQTTVSSTSPVADRLSAASGPSVTSGSTPSNLSSSGLRVATPQEMEEISRSLLTLPDASMDDLDAQADTVDASLSNLKDSLGNSLSLDMGTLADLFDPKSPLPNPNEFNWVMDPSRFGSGLSLDVPQLPDNGTIKGNELIPQAPDFDIMDFLNPKTTIKQEPRLQHSAGPSAEAAVGDDLFTPTVVKDNLEFDLD